jgi:lysozyme
MANAKGIDVSHHNGSIDWTKVAADGVDFAFIKTTDGTGFTDAKFAANWKAAKANGIASGPYHFFRPSEDGKEQAKHFIDHIDLKSGDLRPVVDVEVIDHSGAKKYLNELQEFLDTVEDKVKVKPIIYTLRSFWRDSLGDSKDFGAYPLWIVDLSHDKPRLPSGWADFAFWQKSFEGSVKGIPGNVDIDDYHGTKADMKAMQIQ